MVQDENKIRARKDWHRTKASVNRKNPRQDPCAEKQRETVLCLEAKKKEATKPLYLLRYE